ncbi:hypothetical protein EF910_26755 [Streptomyces sp. WAC07149]|uniref:hypothetical protein n=1 Tax=Streptomyces sp. WAC07149 TaxID=2487425 RepID=UPI000F77EC39|nr:hypothetical protein [Streptomyces sp. WAC07149]RST01624.1 hypothetical protein EF910_26755 [Streptomyces sp. WAC07149]
MRATTRYRAAMVVGAAALLVGGPAWAAPQSAPHAAVAAAPSDSDLEAVRIDPDDAAPGGQTTLHAFVANLGPDTTGSPMTITVTLPRGTEATDPYFPEDCEASQNHRRVRCVFPAGLKSQRSATAQIPIRLDPELEFGVYKGTFTVHSPDDRNGQNNRVEFDIKVVEADPGL